MEYDYNEDLKKMISDNIAAVRESIDDAVKVSGREKVGEVGEGCGQPEPDRPGHPEIGRAHV